MDLGAILRAWPADGVSFEFPFDEEDTLISRSCELLDRHIEYAFEAYDRSGRGVPTALVCCVLDSVRPDARAIALRYLALRGYRRHPELELRLKSMLGPGTSSYENRWAQRALDAGHD